MKNNLLRGAVAFTAALGLIPAICASAGDPASLITPARPGWPLAHPVAQSALPDPPLSLVSDQPKNPAYVAGLPGLPQGRIVTDDYGIKKEKFDGVFIRKSRIENGKAIIPPGGLVYLEDTQGGEVALRGEHIPVLTHLPVYIDYDMSIVVKENVTIPADQSVVVGGHVYHYDTTIGHERMMNHTLHVKTIAGTDWDWAFGNPVLSSSEPGWWGMKFTQLYNQGQAREVTPKSVVFDWLSGVRMDRILLAEEKVFAGMADPGQEWKAGKYAVRLIGIDAAAGTARIQVLDGKTVKLDRTLGPANKERLIEDTASRKALVFEYDDIAGFLVPWPAAVKDGKANLKLYAKSSSLRYGDTYAGDSRFAVYPVGCPSGHNFGFMLVNKDEIRIAPGASVDGPEKYFKIVVTDISGADVRAWHIEDRDGNHSVNLGGPGITNIDLVLGQGRVAGELVLKEFGRGIGVHIHKPL